jgi:hypothetical protein
MPDREKVIKAIDICLGHGKCHDCHYSVAEAGYTAINCRECMMRDALSLLKEQEKEIENLKEIIKKADYTLEIVKDKINDLFKKAEGR